MKRSHLRVLTGVLTAAGLALLATGCSTPQQAAPTKGGTGAQDAGPVTPKINRIVMTTGGPNRESNELRHLGMPDVWQVRPMYEYLVGLDPQTGGFTPQLATEWGVEPDGMGFRYKLRKGVQFHGDAGEFTAKDVVFSRDDLIQKDSLHGQQDYYRDVTKEIQIVNDYEVVFRVTRPDANFLRGHSENEGAMEMRSKADFDKRGVPTMQTPPYAGTGPYQYVERQQGSYIRFERVPYKHWRSTPDFPEFEFRWVKEASTRLASLVTGESQLTTLPQDLMGQADKAGMKIAKGTVPGLRYGLSIRCCFPKDFNDVSKGVEPSQMNDVRVRKAVNKSINRDEFNKAFLAGKGELQYPPHFHPTRQGWDPSWEKRYPEEYGYDPAAAKKLLADAGFSADNPVQINVLQSTAGGIAGAESDMVEAIAGYMRAVGIKAELLQLDPATVSRMQNEHKLINHLELRATSASQYSGVWIYHTHFYGSGAAANPLVPDIDRLFGDLRNTLDAKKQDELYRQIGELMFTQHVYIPLHWVPAEAVYNPTIVADWMFPGSITGTWTHVQNVKAAR